MTNRNGADIKGIISYQYEDVMAQYERDGLKEPVPWRMAHHDEHSWDVEARKEEEQHKAEVHKIEWMAGVTSELMSVLTEEERQVVEMRIYDDLPFLQISKRFFQRNADGSIRRDAEGNPMNRDNKWAHRRWNDALKKMRAAARNLPVETFLQTTHDIPPANPVGSIMERATGEQTEGSRHDIGIMVRRAIERSRSHGKTTS